MRRLFIETDDLDQREYRKAQRTVYRLLQGLEIPDEVFDEVVDNAWHGAAKAWEAVQKADEIYADSSLVPSDGCSYVGSPVVFNTMMEKAAEANIIGKKLIFLRELDDLEWDNIDMVLLAKVFVDNEMFTLEDEVLVKVNIPELIKEIGKNI